MQKVQGDASTGNVTVVTLGNVSTTVVEGSFPSATVTVFNQGTLVLASIFGDNGVTPKANPFIAGSDGSWFFYAANGRYDISLVATGLSKTLGDVLLNDPAGNQAFGGNVTIAGTLGVTGITTLASLPVLNKRIYVDGLKYAINATGIQAAINDAIAAGTFEVWLPPQDILINTTLTIPNGPFALIGGSGGDWNNAITSAVTRLLYNGAGGADLLKIGSVSARPTGVQLRNLFLDGGGIARYTLNQFNTDVTSFMNVKIANAVTACWYQGGCTGTSAFNVSVVEIGNGATGLVLDSSNTFYVKGMALEDLGGSTTPGVFIWIGGGANHSNNFTDVQMDVFASTPVGFLKVTGYDGASPWAGAPASVIAGAARQQNFINFAVAYATPAQAAASQGGDILIDGTVANPVSNVNFFGGEVDALTITAGGQVGFKIDHASLVRIFGVQSRKHTAGAASTVTTTANSSKIFLQWIDQGTDTNLYSGAVVPMALTPTNFLIDKDGNIGLGGQTPFSGTPLAINAPTGWILAAGLTVAIINTTSFQLNKVLLLNALAAPAGAPGQGEFWYDSGINRLRMNNNNVGGRTIAAANGDTFTNTVLTGASSGNNISTLNAQGPVGPLTGNSADQVIITWPLPANILTANPQKIRIRVGLTHTTGTVSTTMKMTLNGVTICTAISGTVGSQSDIMEQEVLWTSATTGVSYGLTSASTGVVQPFSSSLTGLNWAAIQTITITFNVANTDTWTANMFTVEQVT
jgi:hypothetical protein